MSVPFQRGPRIVPATPSRRPVLAAAAFLALAAAAAYHNTLGVPFVFDDTGSIVDNPTIRHLWPVARILSPPPNQTVSGRPLLNLTVALNHALSGNRTWSYHACNLLIHIAAGLALFGVVRRTLEQIERWRAGALPAAFGAALLWTLHPLQTEAVTYAIQRAESMMGLFYLLAFYGFIRSADSTVPGRWRAFSIVCCFLGAMVKEVTATAPVLLLLYDRTFVAGSFSAAWRQRRRFYLGLAAIWPLLAFLVAGGGGNRGGTIGFGVGVAWWAYGLTQFQAVARYLWLSIWPHPLIFEYGTFWIKHAAEVIPFAAIVVALAAATLAALWKRPVAGFFGAWFFCILAPTSLVPGTTQMIVEHRMYLPLAAIVVPAVLGLQAALGRRGLFAALALAAGLGAVTERRNADYRTAQALWRDTVIKRPSNASAHNNLGCVLKDQNRIPEAVAELNRALQLEPDQAEAHYNLAAALLQTGDVAGAIAQFREAVRDQPDYAAAHNNLGAALTQAGQPAEAIPEYEAALRLKPDYPPAHDNLGTALAEMNRGPEAIAQFREALREDPDYAEAHCNLGAALAQAGKLSEAVAEYEAALRLEPDYPKAHNNLATALAKMNRLTDAIAQFQQAVRSKPDYAEAHFNLGDAFVQAGRLPEAIAEYETALRLKPDYAEARNNLGTALLQTGRLTDAIAQFQQAVQAKPDYAAAHFNLGGALAQAGRLPGAVVEYQAVLRLDPDHAGAHNNLGTILVQLGRVPEAVAEFEQVVRLDPANPDAHLNLGSVLLQTGQAGKAAAEYEAVLRLDPASADAASGLAAARQALAAPR